MYHQASPTFSCTACAKLLCMTQILDITGIVCKPTIHTNATSSFSTGCYLIGLYSTAPDCSLSDVLCVLLLGILYTSTCGMASLQALLSSNPRHSRPLCHTHKRHQLASYNLAAETLVSHACFHWSHAIRAHAVCLETQQLVLQGMMP